MILEGGRSGTSEGGAGPRTLASWLARHQPRLLARIRRMMGPEVREGLESGDVLQVVVADALKRSTQADSARLLGWMTLAARNQIIDEARRLRERQQERIRREPPAAPDSSIGAALAHREDAQELERALAELDEDRRRVVELRTLEGQSWQDIARALGRSEEAARKLYNRTLLQLGQRLTERRPG